MSGECPAGCCPHGSSPLDASCPDDLPQASLPERVAHLYTCQVLSTRKIAVVAGIDRQRITRLLHEAGIAVKPRGTGRRLTSRTAEYERLDQLMEHLYLEQRISSTQIAELTGLPDHAVLYRLRARGVPIRTRGGNNREDRVAVSPEDLAALYVNAGLSADETGELLGVSGKIVLRSAHDLGLPVRMGGVPPSRGPSGIELLAILYADPQVREVLDRHGVPVVEAARPIWERFPVPYRLTEDLVADLYEGCGLSLRQIELLTGRPAVAAGALLRASGIKLRPAAGRSPFMRRWFADRT